MNIIIPMTGYGSRFKSAGYTELKPFISVLGKPIIEWIVKKMYPNETAFIFILKKEDVLARPDYLDTLHKLAPGAKLFIIDNWVKKGPVYDVLLASELIPDEEPAIINYCDFYQHWHWHQFKEAVSARGCEGCVPCYTDFHPHLVPQQNVYASCQVDADENLLEIREKYSFASDKTKARHSPGVYYFKTGALLKRYCQQLIQDNLHLNGEFYASLPYNAMVKAGLKVWVPTNADYFCQWGTPQDMHDFLFWMETVRGFQ
ncbi:MAG TPA: capsular biosynthesis protein [Gammaproteobacteria bacterium]|jgi:NDP-sugar pyrophosphorylase family protein|nr:capsular biosynthesis protein [Gammaproteobacteria bacterium]